MSLKLNSDNSSILDVNVNNEPSLRLLVNWHYGEDPDKALEVLTHLRAWEQTQNRFIDDGKKRRMGEIANSLRDVALAFAKTGNNYVRDYLREAADQLEELRS